MSQTKPHKHAAVIKAWADGKQIQSASPASPTFDDPLGQRELSWFDVRDPKFDDHMLYRVKPKPHKWQKEIDAQNRGEKIQVSRDNGKTWCGAGGAMFSFDDPAAIYRIAPKTTKVRLRTAAMTNGSPAARAAVTESGGIWTLHVTTEAAAKSAEQSGDFICWLHDWKEIERPATAEQSAINAAVINAARPFFGIDPAAFDSWASSVMLTPDGVFEIRAGCTD